MLSKYIDGGMDDHDLLFNGEWRPFPVRSAFTDSEVSPNV